MKKTILALGMAAALATGSVMAHEAGSVIVRGGGVLAAVKAKSTTKVGPEVRLDVNHNAQLGLTASYMFTDNWGIELLGATPFSHRVSAVVPALGNNGNLGDVVKVKHLPPSLYVQYYFLNKDSGSRPYVGTGLSYTRFFGSKELTPAVHDLSVKKQFFYSSS
ncbi:outer membrane protein [Bisgaardia hudsonensis]|uniref:Outer membrane protein n=1 Tax=Bisgaardia hudsonensis TaxID=109472 RepID=A0A4R2N312_9PAST|nr:outer membrane protein [Bisgaardia hudsonensis]